MNSESSYFIKIVNHKNNTEKVVNQRVQHNNYSFYFGQVIDSLLNPSTMSSTLNNEGKAQIFEKEAVVSKGYFYNSTTEVDKLIYELSLIKIDDTLSNLFNDDKFCQTNQEQPSESLEGSQGEEQESQTDLVRYNDKSTEPEVSEEDEFGDFQGPEIFSNIDLNAPQTYPYYNPNVIVPEYPYQTYQNCNPCSYNPCSYPYTIPAYTTPVYNNCDTFIGSSVPSYPTQPTQPVTTSWTPELINELKFRLAQPNAGLNHTNYFL
jgi:hypothetical protein